MAEPSFPFYPQRWLANPKLRAASHAERGIWADLLCHMAANDEFGVLRWDLKRISRALSCEVNQLRSLVEQQILKGADNDFEGFVHTNRMGMQVTLVAPCTGPVWFSSAMVMDGYLRKVASESGRKSAAVRGNTFEGVAPTPSGAPSKVRQSVRGAAPSPPVSPSPSPPPPISPTTLSISSKSSGGEPPGPDPSPKRRRAYSGKTLSETEQAVRMAFTAWWTNEAYPAAMGGEVYPFDGSGDASAVLRILRNAAIRFDLEKAKAVASCYLAADDVFIVRQGRPLGILSRQMHSWILQTQLRAKGKRLHEPRNSTQRNFTYPAQNRRLQSLTASSGVEPQPGGG